MKNYRRLFESVTGFTPYEYQKQCFEKFHSGKSIILQAPTGSGKTLAAIIPFIYHWIEWKKGKQSVEKFPRKLIYSLPLRTLANSLYNEISNLISKLQFADALKVTLQTGENADDIFFEGDIIFTTIDQTLSNVLSIPLSLPNKLANINAGAVLSSYLVFDEFHLLEPQKSLSTTLMILKKLKNITTFCLMTATLTDSFISNISNFLKCEVVKVEETDYGKFDFIKNNQKRILNVRDKEIEISDIFELHKNNYKTIIICNTVKSCSKKAKQILEHIEKNNLKTELICLHSRFFQKHRKVKEEKILEYFGRDSFKENIILITTQIIEVGLDISCDVMLTEVSPINSFLQRIGRSARWGKESHNYVFHTEKEYVYDKEITAKTFDVLRQNNESEIDRNLAQKMISEVLTNFEESIFKLMKESNQSTWEKITQSWQTGNKGFARELIRDIHSINIVLINEDDKISNLFDYDSVSMHPHSLKNQLEKIQDSREGETLKIAFNLQVSNFMSFDDDEEDYKLTSIELKNIEFESIVGLNSKYIGYSELTGLDFNGNFGVVSEKIENRKSKINIKYQHDTFEEHNDWMIDVFNEMYSYQFPLSKIKEKHYNEFDFEELIKFMIICHDLGKLNNKWQEIVQKYQSQKSGKEITELLAHTDFDKENEDDVEMMKKFGKKPPHAGIGAIISKTLFDTIYQDYKDSKYFPSIRNLISTSILRHHSNKTITIPNYSIDTNIFTIMLSEYFSLNVTKELEKLSKSNIELIFNDVISYRNNTETFVYFLLQRILRLCDQKSFEKNKRRKN